MKVLLLNPPTSFEQLYGDWDLSPLDTYTPPLGIMHIASYIREHGHQARILDLQPGGTDIAEAVQQTVSFHPDVIGLSAMTINCLNAKRIAEELKGAGCKAPIVLGGAHMTAVPVQTMRAFESVEYGVIGEGEITFLDLIETLADHRPVAGVQGLVWRDATGAVVMNDRRPFIENLDSLPIPAWDLLEGFPDRYPSSLLESKRVPAAGIMTSRGCPFSCTFCDNRVFGTKVRHFSADYSLRMIRHLVSEYAIKDLMVLDDNFLLDREKLFTICDTMISEGIDLSWYCIAHAKSMTPDRLHAIKKAGCWFVEMGIESGNDEILKRIRKKTDSQEIASAARAARKAGLMTKGNFIFGLPGETLRTLEETIQFALDIDIDFFQQSFLTAWPGCQIHSELYTLDGTGGGIESWGMLAHQRVTHVPEGMTEDELIKLSKQAFRRFYLRPKIMLRLLPLMMTPRGLKLGLLSLFVFLKTILGRGTSARGSLSDTNRPSEGRLHAGA